MKFKKALGIILILVGIGLAAGVGAVYWPEDVNSSAPLFVTALLVPTALITPTPLWQTEPLVPTAAPAAVSTADQPDQDQQQAKPLSPTTTSPRPSRPSLTSPAALTPPVIRPVSTAQAATNRPMLPTQSALLSLSPDNVLVRFGVGVPYPPLDTGVAAQLGLGWYLAWQTFESPPRPGGVDFWQMIRLQETGFRPDATTIQRIAQANPGATWLIGNEPDVIWQDNVTPARYAEWYHQLYYLLKEADPTGQVAIGGVTQPTPLRLLYLEQVWSAYQAQYGKVMPVDVWNIHNFILREERGSWGVDIPPGLTVDQGTLFEVADHDDLDTFKAQIINFRQWLVEHGQRHKPLIVSEYGILMPSDYGFGPERVQQFLYGTYEFMLNATDEALGYPADQNHLVQGWAWYSLSDNRYPTGNLIDLKTGALTHLGKAHQEYVSNLLLSR